MDAPVIEMVNNIHQRLLIVRNNILNNVDKENIIERMNILLDALIDLKLAFLSFK
jgi:hypothetical protein